MESLSRPFHSTKLSNATTFSTKNAYDAVFSGHRHKYAGASAIHVEDYREIFGSSHTDSSIPVLDLSNLGELADTASLNFRSSKLDYSRIFGDFRDEEVAVSYEELFGRDKARAPSSTISHPQTSDNCQSSDALKQSNMSYNKISQKSNNGLGLDGTKHVTQLNSTPGFTRFIDEPISTPKIPVHEDKEFKTFDIDFKIHHSTRSSRSSSPTYVDEELDVNSAASASAAALKKAIQNAQESIRIAKESVVRKKKSLKSFSNKNSKNSIKIEGNTEEEVNLKHDGTVVFPDFMENEKLLVVKKVLDEIHEKISESNKEFKDNTIISNSDEYATSSSDPVDTEKGGTEPLNISVDFNKVKIEVTEPVVNILEHQSATEASANKENEEQNKETDSMNDNNLETTKDIDDVPEASSEFQLEDTEADESEEEFHENSSTDQTASDDNEDQHELKSEDNDISDESVKEKNILEETKEHSRRADERLAVEKAIREARERAFADACQRAERDRASVEKATEEVRQRIIADAREKVVKASVGNKSNYPLSKLRAERAAVERATSEARQRAYEKAISQKNVSDLNSSESALRNKAKLEKQNRIMERAAKALAEKEKRDLLAQKEQAERNRLAENLDADIKRWSNGKEGNLRALLSTLQYILGPESGWQAVSLTEILTANAVKKAYRKATLSVHPDKLQQRGATVQQKYICEKVFDLLKAAWNKFNSEER